MHTAAYTYFHIVTFSAFHLSLVLCGPLTYVFRSQQNKEKGKFNEISNLPLAFYLRAVAFCLRVLSVCVCVCVSISSICLSVCLSVCKCGVGERPEGGLVCVPGVLCAPLTAAHFTLGNFNEFSLAFFEPWLPLIRMSVH